MSRSIASWLAVFALVALTLLTWRLADGGASAYALAGIGLVKVAIIGAVFLELFRAWPVWSVIFASVALGIFLGAAGLIAGA